MADLVASLKKLLEERINYDVQQTNLDQGVLSKDADDLEELVTQMTSQRWWMHNSKPILHAYAR